jgi:carbamoyl-phosphate synthase small subunit
VDRNLNRLGKAGGPSGINMRYDPNRHRCRLILKDGRVFEGCSFAARVPVAGEVVFNTGMVGYPESLTDPSYAGQILTLTYPLIGNYGIPSAERDAMGIQRHFESDRVQITALITGDLSEKYSHHDAVSSLSDWLEAHGIPGMTGVDTRALTKHIRSYGVMPGKLVPEGFDPDSLEFIDPNKTNLVAEVTRKDVSSFGSGDVHIVAVDCGIKNNIIREFVKRDVKLTVVPAGYDFSSIDYDGLFISNGPGDPEMAGDVIRNVADAVSDGRPIFGICLGAQVLGLAIGAKTYKLKYGHRAQNQPCIDADTGRCYITSQNHGFAVDASTLPGGWISWFTNANDGTCEGIRHESKPFMAVQFHPEATCGPVDTEFLFDKFLDMVREQTGHNKTRASSQTRLSVAPVLRWELVLR